MIRVVRRQLFPSFLPSQTPRRTHAIIMSQRRRRAAALRSGDKSCETPITAGLALRHSVTATHPDEGFPSSGDLFRSGVQIWTRRILFLILQATAAVKNTRVGRGMWRRRFLHSSFSRHINTMIRKIGEGEEDGVGGGRLAAAGLVHSALSLSPSLALLLCLFFIL